MGCGASKIRNDPTGEGIEGSTPHENAAMSGRCPTNIDTSIIAIFEQANGCVKADKNRATTLYRLAADAGHGAAQCAYALILQEDDVESSVALKYFRESALRGCVDGCYHYGMMLMAKDCGGEARTYLEHAASEGSCEALVALGTLWSEGKGGEIDVFKATDYYRRAAAAGDAAAGELRRKCLKRVDTMKAFNLGKKGFQDGYFDEASIYFLAAAEKGDMDAMYQYGKCLERLGRTAMAIKAFRDAAVNGCVLAFNEYAKALSTGTPDIRRNPEEATRFWKMAIERGNADAMLEYAAYLEAKGEAWSAAFHYEKSIDHGKTEGLVRLGCLYMKGLLGDVDAVKAIYFFDEAIKARDYEGCYWAGMAMLRDMIPGRGRKRGLEYLKHGADNSQPQCQREFGICMLKGRGMAQNKQRAVGYLQAAVNRNDVKAMVALGMCYNEGTGVTVDRVKAAELYRTAADAGSLDGMFSLGVMLMKGRGIPVDEKEAVRMWKLAAERDHQPSMREYGRALIDGRGVGKNVPLGEALIQRAGEG